MKTVTVEIKKNKSFVNGNLYGSVWSNNLGRNILNILFYNNKEGNKIKIIVNGIDETKQFKKEVKKEYKGTNLEQDFFKYANVK